jgi:double-strand break repair protein MRE11
MCVVVKKYKLKVFTEKGICAALEEFIEKDEKNAVRDLMNFQTNQLRKYLNENVKFVNKQDLEVDIERFKKLRVENSIEEEKDFERFKQTQIVDKTQKKKKTIDDIILIDAEEDDILQEKATTVKLAVKSTTRGRGSRGGRSSRGGRGSRGVTSTGHGSRAVSTNNKITNDSDSELEIIESLDNLKSNN